MTITLGEYILQTTPPDKDDVARTSPQKDDRPIGKQIDENMPYRYRYIHLSPHWYASGSGKRINDGKEKPKRKHRKTHGKISFLDLSKLIASRWAGLEEQDNMTKQYVNMIAARELELYKSEMRLFKESAEPAATKHDIIATSSCNSCNSGSVDTKSEHTCDEIKVGGLESTSDVAKKSSKNDKESSADNGSDLGCMKSVDSTQEFSFHPIPSSYWKRCKKSRRHSLSRVSSSRSVRFKDIPHSHRASYSVSKSRRRSALSYKAGGSPNYSSTQIDLENGVESFLLSTEQRGDSAGANRPEVETSSTVHATMEITPDDAMGLIKALSDSE